MEKMEGSREMEGGEKMLGLVLQKRMIGGWFVVGRCWTLSGRGFSGIRRGSRVRPV